MEENNNSERLGAGVREELTRECNRLLIESGKEVLAFLAEFVRKKGREINFEELFSKKNEEELLALWSEKLAKQGLISQVYAGLSDECLIDNMHQIGYLDGMYVGYILAMMSLVDNEAPRELILSVRDDIRPNLIGHHYKNREEFIERYKNEKYVWINAANNKNVEE